MVTGRDNLQNVDGAPPAAAHLPVLIDESLALLQPPPRGVVVDATLGRGGHARRIADALGPGGTLIALDRDPAAHTDEALAWTRGHACQVRAFYAPFSELQSVLRDAATGPVDGVFADLGVSSPQLDDPARGFSFRADGPLDMRMDPSRGESAAELVDRLDPDELADTIYELGEERHSRRVARALKEARPQTTAAAADVIRRVVPRSKDGLDPATRTFQALRIAVNSELQEIDALLAAIPRVLRTGGRTAVISFHSLEDRRVKHAFQREAKGCICPPELPACACGRWPRLEILTRKPITPSDEETRRNPRAGSSKLRGARRLPDPPGQVATW
ncbi:MAG: 16S rRNA (cytosine(1402)-N(4))-methyltransferase RsmH [Deltaproteobacteria bacterium]|nr:16S rRNA (cytosine(1402)-N(4))-methyltransferase RsmH [Deltaproteobacteria bacterium]